MTGTSFSGFGDSSGYPSVKIRYKPTKYNSPVQIINPASVPSETSTKDTSQVSKEFPSDKPRTILIEYTSEYPTGAPSTMSTDKPISNPRAQPISDPDILKREVQEAQVSLQRNIIHLLLYIISYFSSRKIFTRMHRQESMRISHIGVHGVCYEPRALSSITNSQIYNKE